jgi:hypothetical protein
MDKNMEKLLKIDRPKRICDLAQGTIEIVYPTFLLDLVNIESWNEPPVTIDLDLGLDQLEECEE